jgi:hypothetical protein
MLKQFAATAVAVLAITSAAIAQNTASPAKTSAAPVAASAAQTVESPQVAQGRQLVVKYAQNLDAALRSGNIVEAATAAGQLEMSSRQLARVAGAGTPTNKAANRLIAVARSVKKQADMNTLSDADKTLTELNNQLEVISPDSSAHAAAPGVHAKDTTATASTGSKKSGKVVALGNKMCPISNHPAGSMVPDASVTYKGYKVGLCCNECKAEFMKDPDANLKKAMASVK